MIFKYEFFESFLLLMLSVSFAIDGSLPIRQDENAMYPNAEGHSNRVNAESNQIKKGQDNLRKTDYGSISSTTAYSKKVSFTENVSNDEETDLISNYDYDKFPSEMKFQNDIGIDKLNKMENDETLENVTDLPKEPKSTTINDGISTTIKPFYESIYTMPITKKFPKFFKESIDLTSSQILNKLSTDSSEKSSILDTTEESTKSTIPLTTQYIKSSLFKSSMLKFTSQLKLLDQNISSQSQISTSSPQQVTTITNNSNYSTETYEQNSPLSYFVQHSKMIDATPTSNSIEIDSEESNFTQDNVTNELELSTLSSLIKNQTESAELDEQSTDSFNSSDNGFQSDSNISDDSQLTTTTTTENLLDTELSSIEIPQTMKQEFQSPKTQTTLSSLITKDSTFFSSSTSTKVPQYSIYSFSHLTNVNSTSSSGQYLIKTLKVQKKIRKSHEIRIEIAENEPIDVYWTCPPDMVQSDGSVYKWFTVSLMGINYTNPLSSEKDPETGKFILKIQKNSTRLSARYVCISQNSGPFSNQQMFFYQIVVLKSKWIDVGSINTTVLYVNQRAIINCPYGDIIKNNIKPKDYGCSSRITFVENSLSSTKDIYQCSNSKNVTIKMPAILSTTNCSLTLMGCDPQINNTDQENKTRFREKETDIINVDRCRFLNSSYLVSSQKTLLCHGNIYIRFYFDNSAEKCFPFETNICGDDFFTFSSLQECVKTCIKIPSNLETCFYPQNVDESHHCPDKRLVGKYLAHYDIENGECQWFYHCGVSNLTKNVFQSISQCEKVCVLSRRNIKIESIKACRYQDNTNFTNIDSNLTALWVYNKLANKCETSSTYHDRIVRFKSKEKCENVCKVRGSTEICVTRPDNGNCQEKIIQWFYNTMIDQCMKILDGGCGESLNRFDSKKSCEEMCTRISFADNTTVTTVIRKRIMKTNIERKSSKKYTTSTISMRRRHTKPTIERNSTNNSSRTAAFRKRHHRQIPYLNFTTFKFSQIRASANSTLIKVFNATERDLDFDPCYKETLLNPCDIDVGQNKIQMMRYTFRLGTTNCIRVKFSGCRSSENLFDDANDCKSACESRLYSALKSVRCQNPFIHNCMAPDNLIKKESKERYFYLSKVKECVKFNSTSSPECLSTYFTSMNECQTTCIPSPPNELVLHNRCFAKIVLWETSCSEDQKISRWFYFKEINQCLQYTTCPVDYPGNTFLSRQDCENVCKASNILTVCRQPLDIGVGELRKAKFFYNRRRGKCQLFYYNGSLGNLNRFNSRNECEKTCLVTMKNTDEVKFSSLTSNLDDHKEYKGTIANEAWLNENIDDEYCFDRHKYGECAPDQPQLVIKQYSYDSLSKRCELYMFSGCGSISRNSFDSISICDKMCTERIEKKTSSLCSQKVSRCSDSSWIYWVYNADRFTCEPFQSCIKRTKHQFFFNSSNHCMKACSPTLPKKKDLFDICHLPPSINESCTTQSERWFHNQRTRSCYSQMSCEHYGNNFPSQSSCLAACQPNTLKDICQLPMDKGPCLSNDTINYYFDWSTQTCKSFSYGGCLGNRNRFQTLIECQAMCLMKNQCNLKINHPSKCDVHNLNVVENIYHYDIEAGKCKRIEDFQCGDHTEFFTTEHDCNKHCVVPSEFKLIAYKDFQNLNKFQNEICGEPLSHNVYPLCTKFDDWIPKFYYNHLQERCLFFYYNGCDGMEDKGNRFYARHLCEEKCLKQPSTTRPTSTNHQTKPNHFITTYHHITTKNMKIINDSTKNILYKPGICPDSNYQCTQIQENSNKCNSDIDCQNSWKCCPCTTKSSILSMCIEPLSCMTTKYGCCADGITIAVDEQHFMCKKIKPTIDDSSLPEQIFHNSPNDLLLNCQVSGDPKPIISWRYLENNSFVMNPQSTHWDLFQPFWTSQIKIVPLEYKYGLWVCQANNNAGMDEKEVFVHKAVKIEPFLRIYSFDTNQKESINATVNNRVTIHCPIYGYPRPAITWFFNKIAVNATVWSLLIFNRHLLIEKAAFIHAGIWTCQAENSWGPISYKIRLRVLNSIQIIIPPMGTKIKANQGQQIILFCNVQVEGNCSVNWYWEIGSVKTKLIFNTEIDPRILKISSFQNQYLGSYVCEASNNFSNANIKYSIVPYSTNEISINPSGAHFIGTTVILECPVKPSGKLSQTIWKKDNIYVNTNSAQLKLVLRSKLESGFYSCEENKKTHLTYLSVLDPPKPL